MEQYQYQGFLLWNGELVGITLGSQSVGLWVLFGEQNKPWDLEFSFTFWSLQYNAVDCEDKEELSSIIVLFQNIGLVYDRNNSEEPFLFRLLVEHLYEQIKVNDRLWYFDEPWEEQLGNPSQNYSENHTEPKDKLGRQPIFIAVGFNTG